MQEAFAESEGGGRPSWSRSRPYQPGQPEGRTSLQHSLLFQVADIASCQVIVDEGLGRHDDRDPRTTGSTVRQSLSTPSSVPRPGAAGVTISESSQVEVGPPAVQSQLRSTNIHVTGMTRDI